MTRQLHGFLYEIDIIKKFKLIKSENYTSKFDAFTSSNIPVQIKCCKYKSSLCLGDFSRNQKIDKDFILIVGFWKNRKDDIFEQYIIYINHDIYKKMIEFPYTSEMIEEMKSISNDKTDDVVWKKFMGKYKQKYPTTNIIKINMKRDSKKQKRIQCSIRFSHFVEKFCKEFKEIKL